MTRHIFLGVAIACALFGGCLQADDDDEGSEYVAQVSHGAVTFTVPEGFVAHSDIFRPASSGEHSIGIARAGEEPDRYEFVVTVLPADGVHPFDLKADPDYALAQERRRLAAGGAVIEYADVATRSDSTIRLRVEAESARGTLAQAEHVQFDGGPYVTVLADAAGASLTRQEQERLFDVVSSTLAYQVQD